MAQITEQIKRVDSGRFRNWSFVILLCIVLVVVDQATKYILFRRQSFSLIQNEFGIVLFKNFHFAFSLPVPTVITFAIYFLVLAAAIAYVAKKYKQFTTREIIAWVLIFAGAFCNVGERISLGYVRDFIYIYSGIFNIADGYIIVGLIILLFYSNQKTVDN